MYGQQERPRTGNGRAPASTKSADFAVRLGIAEPSRLRDTVGRAADALHGLVADLGLTPAELRAVVGFLTEVGHHADSRRQEWVLLADVLGLSSLVEDLANPRPAGATPNTVAGPFYRAGAPEHPAGATISLDGKGEPLAVSGRVVRLGGTPLAGAMVEVWQANGEGRYENQEPDRQPENNLRGRFRTDGRGRFSFRSVMPAGYALPGDGPVGQLMGALGIALERPAHLHFRVTAEGHERLTTHVYDRADPAIDRDAIFGVKPELTAEFRHTPAGRAVDVDFALCPLRRGDNNRRRKE